MQTINITEDGDYGPFDLSSSSGKYSIYIEGDFGSGTLSLKAHADGVPSSLAQVLPDGSFTDETVQLLEISDSKLTLSLDDATEPDINVTIVPFPVY